MARGLQVSAAALGGLVLGAAGGFFVALAFGDALFGWHDTVGPALRWGFVGGLLGAVVAGAWMESRSGSATEESRHD